MSREPTYRETEEGRDRAMGIQPGRNLIMKNEIIEMLTKILFKFSLRKGNSACTLIFDLDPYN